MVGMFPLGDPLGLPTECAGPALEVVVHPRMCAWIPPAEGSFQPVMHFLLVGTGQRCQGSWHNDSGLQELVERSVPPATLGRTALRGAPQTVPQA